MLPFATFAFHADAAVVIVSWSGVGQLLFIPNERIVDVKEVLVKAHSIFVHGRTVQLRDEQPVRYEMTDVIAVQDAHGTHNSDG